MIDNSHAEKTALAPRALPLLGHLVPFIRNPQEFLSSLSDYGDVVKVRFGPISAMVVCDPELTHQVFLEDRTFDKGGPLFDRAREVLGNGIVTCPHSDHKRLRRMSQPAFRSAKIPAYAQVMQDRISLAIKDWQDGQDIDVFEDMLRITAGTAVTTLFSGARNIDVDEAISDFSTVLSAVFWRMLTPHALDKFPTWGRRRYNRARSRIGTTVEGVIADYRASGKDFGDLFSLLLNTSGPDGPTNTELADAVVTFFVGATDTAAITIAWALHLLATHPEIQQQLHDEVDHVLSGDCATHEDLARLNLTKQVVTETLRLYPPSWILTRVATADTQLGTHFIPAGTKLVVSPYLVHHRADLYGDPDRFDPGRWAERQSPAVRHGIIPFGAGARKCMGDEFAVTEVSLALATIVSRWQLEPTPGASVRPGRRALLFPRGLRLRVARRNASASDPSMKPE